jgi:hypothetical protein
LYPFNDELTEVASDELAICKNQMFPMIDKAKVEFEDSFVIKVFGTAGWAICKEKNGYIFRQIGLKHKNLETKPIFSGKLMCSYKR